MSKFDKKIKELSKNMEVPEEYRKRVDETLRNLPVEEKPQKQKKYFSGKYVVRIAICLLFVAVLFSVNVNRADANIFTVFKQTIMSFFHIEDGTTPQELGVESKEEHIGSKPELFLELKETVVDGNNVYLLVKIMASSNVEFSKEATFDYVAFSKGSNYNTDMLLGGSVDCSLLEVSEEKENEAIYVVSLSTDEEIEDGSQITVLFKDFMRNPYGDSPEMLVEGMWSLSFSADYTVTEEINVEGTDDTRYPFLGKEAVLKSIKITPLGMVMESDVSAVPYDELGISDNHVRISLKMLDGSEILLMSHDLEEEVMVSGGSLSYEREGEKTYQTSQFEFETMVNTQQILGVAIEDLYVPVKNTKMD